MILHVYDSTLAGKVKDRHDTTTKRSLRFGAAVYRSLSGARCRPLARVIARVSREPPLGRQASFFRKEYYGACVVALPPGVP